MDLLLSGRTVDADEARELGLVSRVTEPGEVLTAATAYARDLAANCSPMRLEQDARIVDSYGPWRGPNYPRS